MQIVVRGADVGFSTSFADPTGAAYMPPSATIRVTYTSKGVLTTDTVPMSPSGAAWVGVWSSVNADAGQVDWFISTGGAYESVDEGSFNLVKNRANPDPL